MIRAILRKPDGTPRVLLGLERSNIDQLMDGKPILVNLRYLDPMGAPTELPDVDITIAFDDGDLQGLLEDVKK